MEAGRCVEWTVVWTDACRREWKKQLKRADPRLRKYVDAEIANLRNDPYSGHALTGNLKGNRSGRRSISLRAFSYRIVYELDYATCTIDIQAIEPRKRVYPNLARSG